jgi:hypothetical protein
MKKNLKLSDLCVDSFITSSSAIKAGLGGTILTTCCNQSEYTKCGCPLPDTQDINCTNDGCKE